MTKQIEKKQLATPVVDFENDKVKDMTDEQKQELFKSTNYALLSELFSDALPCSMSKASLDQKDLETAETRVKNLMSSILTGNGLETILASQMVVVHNLQMSAATYAKLHKSVALIKPYANMVTKLSNTFIQQAQLLMKLQGKGQQKVTVEHVNVHEGGQAIVGNVTNNQGAEKDD